MSDSWTIGRVVKWAADDFKAKGLDSPRLDAELLLCEVLGVDRIRILLDAERPLAPAELSRYRDLIKRRRVHEPVAYLRGSREFYGRSVLVDRSVLIPRPDTETLVEVALRRTRPIHAFARLLDLCTGSGCVAISLARERPTWHVDAVDLSPDALATARKNAQRLGAVWNVRWLEGDLFAPLGEVSRPAVSTGGRRPRYDIITANPPYIPDAELLELDAGIRDFEPRMALSGGVDGFSITTRLVAAAPGFLADGGVLAVEIMAGTSAEVMVLFEQAGFVDIEVTRDYGGTDRVVSGVRG
jgi:release factor glutamine methyltransferase